MFPGHAAKQNEQTGHAPLQSDSAVCAFQMSKKRHMLVPTIKHRNGGLDEAYRH